jgi:hypothetical protein
LTSLVSIAQISGLLDVLQSWTQSACTIPILPYRIGVLISDPSQGTDLIIASAADPAAVHIGGSSPMDKVGSQ